MNWTAGVRWTYPTPQPIFHRLILIRDWGEGQDTKTLVLLLFIISAALTLYSGFYPCVGTFIFWKHYFVLHIINVIIPFPSGCERVVTLLLLLTLKPKIQKHQLTQYKTRSSKTFQIAYKHETKLEQSKRGERNPFQKLTQARQNPSMVVRVGRPARGISGSPFFLYSLVELPSSLNTHNHGQ